jgi:hypothetical protein
MDDPDTLKDRQVLLIERDDFLAGYVGDGLRHAGAQILGPARSIDEANTLIGRLRSVPDAGVISIDVFEAAGFVMLDRFAQLNIPLLLIARRPRMLMPSFPRHSILTVPFAAYQVVNHVRAVVKAKTHPSILPPKAPLVRGH